MRHQSRLEVAIGSQAARLLISAVVVCVLAWFLVSYLGIPAAPAARMMAPVAEPLAATPSRVPSRLSSAPLLLTDDESAPIGRVDRASFDETPSGYTATGIPTYTGPRGGQYHYSKSGRKVYEKQK
jgi:hypothetical protein